MATLIPMPAIGVAPMHASRLGTLEAARQAALLRMPGRPADNMTPATLQAQHQAQHADSAA